MDNKVTMENDDGVVVIDYQKSLSIINKFYIDCVAFWRREGSKTPELDALNNDIKNVKYNPFTPNGALLDSKALQVFVDTTTSVLNDNK